MNVDIDKLADLWRQAENYYIATGSGWQKDRLCRFQKSLKLSEKQINELEEICYSMGI
jgi:hypothetical protein